MRVPGAGDLPGPQLGVGKPCWVRQPAFLRTLGLDLLGSEAVKAEDCREGQGRCISPTRATLPPSLAPRPLSAAV